jgi:hypothetical protein
VPVELTAIFMCWSPHSLVVIEGLRGSLFTWCRCG